MNYNESYHGKKIDTPGILTIEEAAKINFNTKKCIVTGVTGQDGSLMVDYLLKNTDYLIFGGVRRLSVYNHENIKHINSNRFKLINFDLTDPYSISRIIEKIKPEYFINFGAQSFVAGSWDFPRQTWDTNSSAILDILESIRLYKPDCRLYQAGSSEEFGNVIYTPQDEKHPLRPRSPYGASKAASRQLVKVYRDSYNLYAIQGWLFNHEGPRRGEEFVTQKIIQKAIKIKKAIEQNENFMPLELGNIYATRDWSDAEDMIDGVWRMLNQEKYNKNYKGIPEEYILASEESHSIKEFVEKSFLKLNLKGDWEYNGEKTDLNEIYVKNINGIKKTLIQINQNLYRPAEVNRLLGCAGKIKKDLKWRKKTSFDELIEKMIKHGLKNEN
jgi:GDPmannose 4,6-dehydratase